MGFFTQYKRPPSPSVKFVHPSLTRQEFARDADINHILERYKETGFLVDPTRPSSLRPMFGDFSNVSDYQSALDMLNKADDAFMSLPASVRARFDNDPQLFLSFVDDPSNADELVRMGLATKRPVVSDVDKSETVDKSDS